MLELKNENFHSQKCFSQTHKPPGNVETSFFQVFLSAILENRKICWGEKMKIIPPGYQLFPGWFIFISKVFQEITNLFWSIIYLMVNHVVNHVGNHMIYHVGIHMINHMINHYVFFCARLDLAFKKFQPMWIFVIAWGTVVPIIGQHFFRFALHFKPDFKSFTIIFIAWKKNSACYEWIFFSILFKFYLCLS